MLINLGHVFCVEILGEELQAAESTLREASPDIRFYRVFDIALNGICTVGRPSMPYAPPKKCHQRKLRSTNEDLYIQLNCFCT